MTPLWWAAEYDRLEVVKLLQDLGADINAASYTVISPVNSACSRKQIETVKFLVKRGADINRPDEHGRTCLMNSRSMLGTLSVSDRKWCTDERTG